jgi:hypothetical protein
MSDPASFRDFTRANYRRLTEMAMARYRLVPVFEWDQAGTVAVWRHDVDLSPQAALSMGRVEAILGVRSTYYFNLRSDFYHVLEAAVASIVKELAQLGHEIGLHLDARTYDVPDADALAHVLHREANVFSSMLGIDVRSFSFHNPDASTQAYTASTYGGLVNAYGGDLMSTHPYCSDSNGYWRFTPLEAFLSLGHPAVYVLTHPGWWQNEPMAPRNRVVRCVEGRAAATLRLYDETLERSGRRNIR